MQTRWSQEPVARKGREGASPSRRTHGTHPTGVGGSLQSCYGGVRFPGGPLWRVNGSGCPGSLLTSARYEPWDSSSPLSAMEDEPVRAPAPLGKRMGQVTGWDSGSPSSAYLLAVYHPMARSSSG